MNENLAITIFENGANALRQTINVNDGSCTDKELYDLLKDESVDYFISQIEKQIPKWIDVKDKMPAPAAPAKGQQPVSIDVPQPQK